MERFYPKEPRLIEIKNARQVIFVGDTHGDWEVSQKIIKDCLEPGNILVFLGDYVDRGPNSQENLDFLLKTKHDHPERIYLLQGNHEGHHILPFWPADFWESLDKKDYEGYSVLVGQFPLVAVAGEIIALHGVLPDVESLDKINQIENGGREWQQVTWGDFVEKRGEYLGSAITGRPQFGRDYFSKLMERFGKKILIRSHQPTSPLFMFDNRCLTIFTSCSYGRPRTIAILDLEKEIKTAKDLEILRI